MGSAAVVEVTRDEQPRRYAAREIDLTVTNTAGDREYTITPALIDAIGRRENDNDIDTYIDRHGVAGLATALTYAVARERGEVTHCLMAEDLECPEKIRQRARTLAEQAEECGVTTGVHPAGFAAACLYKAGREEGRWLTQSQPRTWRARRRGDATRVKREARFEAAVTFLEPGPLRQIRNRIVEHTPLFDWFLERRATDI